MTNNEMNVAAEVMNREIASTRAFFDRIGQRIAALKATLLNALVARIRFGTETDSRFLPEVTTARTTVEKQNIWQDIYYPNLSAVRKLSVSQA